MFEKNINRVYWLNFSWSFLLIQAIVVPYFQSKGLSMAQVFIVQSSFSLTLCLLDIPTGYFADLIGRKQTLILGSFIKAIGGVILVAAQGLNGLILAYVFIGIANSLYSGADVSMLYESHEAMASTDRPQLSSIFGKRIFHIQMGSMTSAIIGGLIASYSIQAALILNAVFAFVPLLIAITLKEAPRKTIPKTGHLNNLIKIKTFLKESSKQLRYLSVFAVLYGTAPVLAIFAFQGFWKSSHIPLLWFGYITGGFSFIGALSGRSASKAKAKFGPTMTLATIGLLPVVGFLGVSTSNLAIAVLFGSLLEICRGLSQGVINEAFNSEIPSDIRATLNSMISFGSRILVAALGPMIGWVADRYGFSMAFGGLGVFYAIAFLISCLPLVAIYNSKQGALCQT